MIKHDDEEFGMVKDVVDQLVDYLYANPSPLAWVSDGAGGWKRPKSGSEIKARSVCFWALEDHFKKELGIDFTYSWNDFLDAFRDEWCWRTSP